MTCYQQSNLCYGTEWLVPGHGVACSGHKEGRYKRPVVGVEVIEHGLTYPEIKKYLSPFVEEELGHASYDIYGQGDMGEVVAESWAFVHDRARLLDRPCDPTHLFIVWDLVRDDLTGDRVGLLMDRGVVINSLVP